MAGLYLLVCASQEEPDGIRCDSSCYLLVPRFQPISGIPWDDVSEDPGLGAKRIQLVTNAVRRLAEARMVNWNTSNGMLRITDLGKIAAKYYIRIASIEIFNERFRPRMSEADVLRMLSYSTEVRIDYLPLSAWLLMSSRTQFNQIQLRESEIKELKVLEKKVPCEVEVGCQQLADIPPFTSISGENYATFTRSTQ